MSRTDVIKVAGILAKNWDGETGLQPFIDAAGSMVDDIVAYDEDSVMTAAKLEIVERYVAAHLYACQDPMYRSKNTGRAGASFHGDSGLSLDFTPYGQTAQDLDVSGYLRANQKSGIVGAAWLGKPPSDQIDYVDRD